MRLFNKKIQKLTEVILTALIVVSVSGCKDTLNEAPKSVFDANRFYTTPAEANLAVLGVYEAMCNESTYGFTASILYDNDNDISQVRDLLFTDFRGLAHYVISAENTYTQATWKVFYNGINRANLAIERIPKMADYSDPVKSVTLKRYLGEALVLRGFYYAELTRLFGGVPLKLNSSQSGDDFRIARNTTTEVYVQAIKHFQEGIELLPEGRTSDERISKMAAKGLLARVALFAGGYALQLDGTMQRPDNYKSYYQLALKESREVMESGLYSLNPSYEQFFRNQCQLKIDPTESMFEAAFYSLTSARGTSSLIGQWNAPLTAPNVFYARTNSYVKTTPLFRNSFSAGDLRKDVSVATYQINASGNKVEYAASADQNYSPGKWRREYQAAPLKDLNYTDINYVILRYADLLLMRAEAENEVNEGPTAEAYNAINIVRRRAFGKDVNVADATVDLPAGLSKNDFFLRLKDERAWELCFEGLRKYDLIRWNLMKKSVVDAEGALKAYRTNFPYIAGTNFVSGKHEVYPIPLREIDLNDKLKQNPGY